MPELPEVETVVRDLKKEGLIGTRVLHAWVGWPRSIAQPEAEAFRTQVRNQHIAGLARRGKFLIFTMESGSTLLIHLRMTGRLYFCNPEEPLDKHEHITLTLSDQRQLRFRDTRKFGRWYLLNKDAPGHLAALGPEPLDPQFTAAALHARLHQHQRQLKPLLLDQSFIAGLGNIYVDEALWQARLHPATPSHRLSKRKTQRLHQAIQLVLRRGIQNLGTSLGPHVFNYARPGGQRGQNQEVLNVFRRTGEPCVRCRRPITRIIVAQRSTHLCLRCQRKGS